MSDDFEFYQRGPHSNLCNLQGSPIRGFTDAVIAREFHFDTSPGTLLAFSQTGLF
jgi:hypothetical protein